MPSKIGVIIDPPESVRKQEYTNGVPTIKLTPDGSNGDLKPPDEPRSNVEGIPEFIAGFETQDPGEPDTIRIDTAKRKRGRPVGSGKRSDPTSKATSADSIIDLKVLLLSLHQMGAALCDIEELALDQSEADAYADAIRELAKHYPTNVNPKILAWLNFGAVVGGIYGSRFYAYRERLKKERKTAGRVVEIPRQQTGTEGKAGRPTPNQAPTTEPANGLSPSQVFPWEQVADEYMPTGY